MWQGWIGLLDGIFLTILTFITSAQTAENMMIAGIIAIVFGFWASKDSWQGIFLGMLGVWMLGGSFTNYLQLPINFLLTGLSIALIGIMLALEKELPFTPQAYHQ